MSPTPEPEHQDILLAIARRLDEFVRSRSLGKVYIAPIDVVLSMTDIVQPDIVLIARNRLSIVRKKNIIAAPDLVLEIYVRGDSRFGNVTIFRAPESAASSILSGFTLPVEQIFQV